jgi:Integrase zinc binding domain
MESGQNRTTGINGKVFGWRNNRPVPSVVLFLYSSSFEQMDDNPDPNGRDMAYMMQQIAREHKVKYAALLEGNKSYFKQWTDGKLEVENGILYQWEEPARATKIRQLQRRVVPKGLRRHIIVAYHATPLAGHVGIYKTYWRIVTRYWWPSLLRDIKEAVTTCAHCILGNS